MKKLYTRNDFIDMPWKNGLGVTTELYKNHLSEKIKLLEFDFRLSVATLNAPVPFSFFPDYKRIIMLQQGNGFRLYKTEALNDNAIVIDNLHMQHTFLGTETIRADLIDGPCLDFNIFWNPSVMNVFASTNEVQKDCDHLFIFNREAFELNYFYQEKIELSFSESHPSIAIGIKLL